MKGTSKPPCWSFVGRFPMALAASPFDLTKAMFARFENRPSLEVLSLLAKTPISLLGPPA